MKHPQPAWISAALSLLSLVVVIVTAAVLVSRPAGGWPAFTEQDHSATNDHSATKAAQPEKYTFAKVGNACDLVDLAAVERLGRGGRSLDQTHHEIKMASGGSLTCQGGNLGASITVIVQLGNGSRDLYDLSKQNFGATGTGRSSGTAPEFGSDTYYTAVESTSFQLGTHLTSAQVDLGVFDTNLYITVHIDVSAQDAPLTADDVLRQAKTQTKHILETLHS
ncbi:hypothetical protein ACWCW7_18885 [Nocardia tengchongensis]